MNHGAPEKPVTVSIARKSGAPDETPAPAIIPASKPVIARPHSAGERFALWITSPFVAAPIVIICVGLLGWSLLLRRPQELARVQARSLPIRASVVTATMEDVALLRAHATIALGQILTNANQLPRLISTMEQQARNAGFVTELSTRPVETPIAAIPEFTSHRVVLKLENNYDREAPAFRRLLQLLQQFSDLEVKADVAGLTIQSLGDGVTSATVEIDFQNFQADAKTPPK